MKVETFGPATALTSVGKWEVSYGDRQYSRRFCDSLLAVVDGFLAAASGEVKFRFDTQRG
jgi:hypothetical protein